MTKLEPASSPHEPVVGQVREPLCSGEGPFRPNVAALILRRNQNRVEILLGERRDTPGCWQWPQGGRERGESPEAAVAREVAEEIGVAAINIRYRFPIPLRYRFPIRLQAKFAPYLGQEQTYFAAILPPGVVPDLDAAATPEFRSLKWFPIEESGNHGVWFKAGVYRVALEQLQKVLDTLKL